MSDLDEVRAAIDSDPGRPGVQSAYGAEEFAAGFDAGRAERFWDRCRWTLMVVAVSVVVTVATSGRLW